MLAFAAKFRIKSKLNEEIDINGFHYNGYIAELPDGIEIPLYVLKDIDVSLNKFYSSSFATLTTIDKDGYDISRPYLLIRVETLETTSKQDFTDSPKTIIRVNGKLLKGANCKLTRRGPDSQEKYVCTLSAGTEKKKQRLGLQLVGYNGVAKELDAIPRFSYVNIYGHLVLGLTDNYYYIKVKKIERLQGGF